MAGDMPNFDFGGGDIWGEITDAEIIETLAQLEAENDVKAPKTPLQCTPSPAAYVPVHPSIHESKRFASLTENDVAKLEMDRHEKNTMDTTAWAVRVIKGELGSFIFETESKQNDRTGYLRPVK
jgi:hypothetical protein